jgi:hypothetical protein
VSDGPAMICLSDAANVATCAESMFSPMQEEDEHGGRARRVPCGLPRGRQAWLSRLAHAEWEALGAAHRKGKTRHITSRRARGAANACRSDQIGLAWRSLPVRSRTCRRALPGRRSPRLRAFICRAKRTVSNGKNSMHVR